MKIKLYESYTKAGRLQQIEEQLAKTEEKLKTPERTVDDLVRHMQLLKERNSILSEGASPTVCA